jgi:hypothetical protein
MKQTPKLSVKAIYFICCISFANSLFAQKDSSLFMRKNEIGICINPILSSAIGANYANKPNLFDASYKRVFGNWAIRVNYAHNLQGTSNEAPPSYSYGDPTLIPLQSQSWKYNYKENTERIGYEYRYKFNNGWSFIGGADLQARQSTFNSELLQNYYHLDSMSNSGNSTQSYYASLSDSKTISEQKNKTTEFGLGISTGLIVPLGKRFLIMAEQRAGVFYGTTKTVSNDYAMGTKKESSSNNTNVNVLQSNYGLFELSLFYRFGKLVKYDNFKRKK